MCELPERDGVIFRGARPHSPILVQFRRSDVQGQCVGRAVLSLQGSGIPLPSPLPAFGGRLHPLPTSQPLPRVTPVSLPSLCLLVLSLKALPPACKNARDYVWGR